MYIVKKSLLLTSTLFNVNKAIKLCRFLQFLKKNEINNYKLKNKGKIRNLCVRPYIK